VKIFIGTSGWHYKHWLGGVFYPPGTTGADMFEFYARHFNTVEINNSFYRLPTAKTFDAWRESSPRDFVFAVKASRFITHMKKLKDAKAQRIDGWRGELSAVYVYFNNDPEGAAVKNALTLKTLAARNVL